MDSEKGKRRNWKFLNWAHKRERVWEIPAKREFSFIHSFIQGGKQRVGVKKREREFTL